MPKKSSSRSVGLTEGWRSGLEEAVGAQLDALGVKYRYEKLVIPYEQPVKPRRYTPDYLLPNGIIIETKGRFVTADRQKHKMVKAQWPLLDIRFVFSNPRQRISKQSATTYAQWCESHDFRYAKGIIPLAWIEESDNARSLACALSLLKKAP